jgi:hypothetical protein
MVLPLLIVLIFFVFRQTVLEGKIKEKQESLLKRGIVFLYQDIEFKGISTIQIGRLRLGEIQKTEFLRCDSISCTLSLWSLLGGHISISDLSIAEVNIQIVKKDSISNTSFLTVHAKKKNEDSLIQKNINYKNLISKALDRFQKYKPKHIEIESTNIFIYDEDIKSRVNIPLLLFENDIFKMKVVAEKRGKLSEFRCAGMILPEQNLIFSKFVSNKGLTFPYIDKKYDFHVGIDTGIIRLKYSTDENDRLVLDGYAWASGLFVKNERIARDTVAFPEMLFKFVMNIDSNSVELDSSSMARINQLAIHPYIKFTREKSKKLSLKIITGDFDSENLFTALPSNLFTTLKGIETSGTLNYRFSFDIDFANPDSLIFNSEMERKDFRITHFGAVNYAFINEPFMHTAFEKGIPLREFEVGPSNPYFTRLSEVSPYIINAILCTEDGGFFQHRGFIEEAFRESVIQNIKEQRFARGGSTITMQLVKNVYLNRNKNVARKMEEILITWLIENQGLVSKERMFEVYLNIIEWGPGIYGIGEASDYYFSKTPRDLSLQESIFLASIIPIPKYYRSRLLPGGELKPEAHDFIRLIQNKMITKGMITPSDTLQYSIVFSEKAVFAQDTILSDTIPEILTK